MRKQSFGSSLGGGGGEPVILVEESTVEEDEAERNQNESPPRSLDPDAPSLTPYLLSPWREARKHSLPTPQCTSGITASQVRRLSERGGEGSGPTPREAAFLATLSQAPAPQPGGRRHSVVTISKVPPTLFGRNRRESIAAFPMCGATRILPNRRDSTSSTIGPSSNSGSMHNLLDIMDNIAELKPRKARLKIYKTPSQERFCEVESLEGTSSTQRYTQHHKRRFSEFPTNSSSPTPSLRRGNSEIPRSMGGRGSRAAGIVCSNTDLISILSSLSSSATEINRCTDEPSTSREDNKLDSSSKNPDQKRNKLKSFRSNSFDVSILHDTKWKQIPGFSKNSVPDVSTSTDSKKQAPKKEKEVKKDKPESTSLNFKLDETKGFKAVKEALTISLPIRKPKNSVVWDGTSGTKVDAQLLGSAIEQRLAARRVSDSEASGSDGKSSASPNKLTLVK